MRPERSELAERERSGGSLSEGPEGTAAKRRPRAPRIDRGGGIRTPDPLLPKHTPGAIGGSGKPLPLVFRRKFATWGNRRKPRAASHCRPIVSRIRSRLPAIQTSLPGRNQSRTYAIDDVLHRVTCVIGHRHRRQKNGSFKKVEDLLGILETVWCADGDSTN